jgi:hypothetical protein
MVLMGMRKESQSEEKFIMRLKDVDRCRQNKLKMFTIYQGNLAQGDSNAPLDTLDVPSHIP